MSDLNRSRRAGFTLIELSIVMVVIGLIVGGILVGRDLIEAASVRGAISEVEKLTTATYAFRVKYNCLPGDCNNITAVFSGATNGNGNGQIAGFWWMDNSEMWQYPYQLSQALLIPGSYSGTNGSGGTRHAVVGTNIPQSKYYPTAGFTVLNWGNYTDGNDYSPCVWCTHSSHVILFGATDSGCCETYAPAFSTDVAFAIDTKTDDGKPAQGKVGFLPRSSYTNCVTTSVPSTSAYDTSKKGNYCSLAFWDAF